MPAVLSQDALKSYNDSIYKWIISQRFGGGVRGCEKFHFNSIFLFFLLFIIYCSFYIQEVFI